MATSAACAPPCAVASLAGDPVTRYDTMSSSESGGRCVLSSLSFGSNSVPVTSAMTGSSSPFVVRTTCFAWMSSCAFRSGVPK